MQDSHTDYSSSFNNIVFNAIPVNTQCLDVGCSTGNLGSSLLSSKGCSVDGIETNSAAADMARSRGYGKVYDIDLNCNLDSVSKISREAYDVIICADVLEHLAKPEMALKKLSALLKPDGMFIISLPNVAFALTRWHLLLGKWEYKDYGILDRTHLRFFTIKSGLQMVKSTGLKIVTVSPYNQFGALRYISPLDKWFPSLFSYQFLIIAKRSND